jgi:hypothetical protein
MFGEEELQKGEFSVYAFLFYISRCRNTILLNSQTRTDVLLQTDGEQERKCNRAIQEQ